MTGQPMVSLNKALLNPYFLGGGTLGGGRLTSHEIIHEFDMTHQEAKSS